MSSSQEIIYSDTAGVSRIQPSVISAINNYYCTHATEGKVGIKNSTQNTIPSLKNEISTLINCSSEEIAITKNTTEGINIIAQGYPWQPGDRILIPDNEYPANVYPWLFLKNKGVIIDYIPTKNGVIALEDINQLIHSNTKILALSHVGYLSGYTAPLNKLGELCKQNDIHFFVDAAQSAGVLPIDVKKSNITALSTCGWKWIMAPVGVGFLYCSKALLKNITPVYVGADALDEVNIYSPKYPFTFFQDSRKFEYSSSTLSVAIGLNKALEIINTISVKKIEKQTTAHIKYLDEALKNIGFNSYLKHKEEPITRSGILSVKHKKITSEELHQKLLSHNIHTALWHGYIRFSPSYLNSKEESSEIVHCLTKYL
ncbi:aminotransferase class V-fold PLP-dependent enzyme [Aquimarina spinulae]|uniref:aminotransferase class V-fold PLP-dependent enzyme n=1 Tax=Aquimarina spinulae TaxID=1192023 RepID=UPI000D54E02C|nr:aminotransferase class V-fold PLP-dependent enzyme [Aquimarina spinulae]